MWLNKPEPIFHSAMGAIDVTNDTLMAPFFISGSTMINAICHDPKLSQLLISDSCFMMSGQGAGALSQPLAPQEVRWVMTSIGQQLLASQIKVNGQWRNTHAGEQLAVLGLAQLAWRAPGCKGAYKSKEVPDWVPEKVLAFNTMPFQVLGRNAQGTYITFLIDVTVQTIHRAALSLLMLAKLEGCQVFVSGSHPVRLTASMSDEVDEIVSSWKRCIAPPEISQDYSPLPCLSLAC